MPPGLKPVKISLEYVSRHGGIEVPRSRLRIKELMDGFYVPQAGR
jgi:hypothetical protein